MATTESIRTRGAGRSIDVTRELAKLEAMTTKQLKQTYAEVYGEATNANNKRWLVKRIIWRMQANAEGDLSERARRRALEIADDADLRTTMPKVSESEERPASVATGTLANSHDDRVPVPGTVLTREYKGAMIVVTVRERGFECRDEVYKSLSAVAKAVTGSHVNGFLFFRLGKYAEGRA